MQNILNFHVEATSEKLTPRTGVAILGEYLKGLDLENLCNRYIPNSIHHKAYDPFEFIYPLRIKGGLSPFISLSFIFDTLLDE